MSDTIKTQRSLFISRIRPLLSSQSKGKCNTMDDCLFLYSDLLLRTKRDVTRWNTRFRLIRDVNNRFIVADPAILVSDVTISKHQFKQPMFF